MYVISGLFTIFHGLITFFEIPLTLAHQVGTTRKKNEAELRIKKTISFIYHAWIRR